MRGSAAHGADLLVRVAEQAISVPVLVTAWGAGLYGEWLMLFGLLGWFVLGDLGFATAVANEVARRAGAGDMGGARRLHHAAFRALVPAALALALLLGALAAALPVASWLGFEGMSGGEARTVLGLMLACAVIHQVRMLLLGAFRALGLYPTAMGIVAGAAGVRAAVVMGAAGLFGARPVAAAAIMALALLAELLLLLRRLARAGMPAPALRRAEGEETEPLAPYLRLGLDFMIMPLTLAMTVQGMLIMVGVILGPAAAAMFGAHRTLARFGFQAALLGARPLRAEAAVLAGQGERALLARLTLRVTRLVLWASLAIAAAQLLASPWLFETWTRGRLPYDEGLFALLVAAVVAQALWETTAAIRLGVNRHRPVARGYFVLSAAGLGAAWALVGAMGPAGAAWPALAVDVAMAALALALTLPVLGIGWGGWARAALRPPLPRWRGRA